MSLRGKILAAASLLSVIIAAYWPALYTRPVADDFRIVGQIGFDDAIRSLQSTVGYGRNEYRPVVAVSFALSNALWDENYRGYHLESIVLHALNAGLLFVWLFLLIRSAWIPITAALLFAVHPVNHERVVWIAARDSLLSTFFLLGVMIAYTLLRHDLHVLSGRRSWWPQTGLLAVCLAFFSLSLVSYEGSAVIPALVFGLEFFCFSQPSGDLWSRCRSAAHRTFPFAIVLAVYIAFWMLVFSGKVGQYDLSYSAADVAGNYFSLLYRLFFGHQHLAGVLYFGLILLGLNLPREWRPLLVFSVMFMLVSFLPFSIISGFTSRFAYTSALGYSLLIALLLRAGTLARRESRWHFHSIGVTVTVTIFLILGVYYVTTLRGRISDWKIAGDIADHIPRQIKARYPELPDNSTLVLARIPRMYGRAYVYPLGLRSSIQRYYPGRSLEDIYGEGEIHEVLPANKRSAPDALFFRYNHEHRRIEEIDTR